MKHADLLVKGSTYQISLTKLTGKAIKDITGYLENEFGEPSFKVCQIVMEDGTLIGVEGEHDFPYLVEYGRMTQPNMDSDTLDRLYEESQESEDVGE